MNFWVYDLLVENATPPPGGGAKKQVGEVQARSGGSGAEGGYSGKHFAPQLREMRVCVFVCVCESKPFLN